MVRKVNSIYGQSVVLELWTLASDLVEVVQVQVECFDTYYPSLATSVFVLRSNLTAQAFGKKYEQLEQATRLVTARDRDKP